MLPTKVSVGVMAECKAEAERIVKERYGNQMNFELLYLDVATEDVAKQLKFPSVN
jgi:hypothetical protein